MAGFYGDDKKEIRYGCQLNPNMFVKRIKASTK
jgi:hypothetical protein